MTVSGYSNFEYSRETWRLADFHLLPIQPPLLRPSGVPYCHQAIQVFRFQCLLYKCGLFSEFGVRNILHLACSGARMVIRLLQALEIIKHFLLAKLN